MSNGRGTADWMSSYSDAVFAVIVTIMVLQLKPPDSTRFSALFDLWPTAISYVVSYVFVAIIWINHHNLTRILGSPSLGLIWVNFIHLFLVSLLPFTTAWMAQTKLAAVPVMVYASLFVCIDGVYNIFERHILLRSDDVAEQGRLLARRRSLLALGLFAAAAVVAALEPLIGFALICAALVLHLKPDVGYGARHKHRTGRPTAA